MRMWTAIKCLSTGIIGGLMTIQNAVFLEQSSDWILNKGTVQPGKCFSSETKYLAVSARCSAFTLLSKPFEYFRSCKWDIQIQLPPYREQNSVSITKTDRLKLLREAVEACFGHSHTHTVQQNVKFRKVTACSSPCMYQPMDLEQFISILVDDTPMCFDTYRYNKNTIILLALTTHLRVLASSVLRFRDHTQGHNTVGRTPLDA
jgi:hypothetical protein